MSKEEYTLDNVIEFLISRLEELDRQFVNITNRYDETKKLLEHFQMMKKNTGEDKK